MRYSRVQTGANTQSGGLKTGFCSVRYQVPTLSAVTQPPDTCCSFIQRGTASSTMAEQITRVSPVLTSTEPVAFGAKPGVNVTGRSWEGVRPSCRVMRGG